MHGQEGNDYFMHLGGLKKSNAYVTVVVSGELKCVQRIDLEGLKAHDLTKNVSGGADRDPEV